MKMKPPSGPKKQTQSNPILEAMFVNFCAAGYYERIHSHAASFFLCSAILANTIYSILPNFPRQTLTAVSGVKMGLLQKLIF